VGEEVESDAVVARFGDQRPGIEDTLVEVPPVEDWIMVTRLVKRYAKVIDNRIDYLLRDPHREPGGSEHTPFIMLAVSIAVAGGSLGIKSVSHDFAWLP